MGLLICKILIVHLAVIVPPNGMCGKLIGCCPSDVVKKVYFRYMLEGVCSFGKCVIELILFTYKNVVLLQLH